jgi:hypothetical protein
MEAVVPFEVSTSFDLSILYLSKSDLYCSIELEYIYYNSV